MIVWLVISGVAAVAVLAYVLAPLWCGVAEKGRMAHRDAVIAALRAERAHLQEEYAAGRIDKAAYQAALDELRVRLLAERGEEHEADGGQGESTHRSPALAAGIVAAALAATTGLYLWVGAPQWADDAKVAEVTAQARAGNAAGAPPFTPEQIRGLVARLADRLAEQPNDLQGWRMLARSYMVLQDAEAAQATWTRLGAKIPDDPEVLLDWGELLAAASGGFTPEAVRLIEQAVAHHPPSPRALALAGAVASAAGNPQQAIAYWEQLLPLTAENPEARQAVEAAIAEERQKLPR